MIKRVLFYTLIVVASFVASYFLHDALLSKSLPFSLFNNYLFHAIAAVVVYAIIELMADKLPSQAGYAYLAAIFIKMGVFMLFFQESIFGNVNLVKSDKLSLIIPLFLFLIIEAIGVSKLLNSK
ncbi:DUF6168 family protein [Pseudofulvibacter geojedonensis]|uniref:DUF6168 family protein n=1 Tax=Pseudofulvibacter geojedonensis TaxID=1123758 RepID=A0ABW3I3W0_9FLAO